MASSRPLQGPCVQNVVSQILRERLQGYLGPSRFSPQMISVSFVDRTAGIAHVLPTGLGVGGALGAGFRSWAVPLPPRGAVKCGRGDVG